MAKHVITRRHFLCWMAATITAKHVITRRHFLCWMAAQITPNWSIKQYTFSYFFVNLEANLMFYSLGVRDYFLWWHIIKIANLCCWICFIKSGTENIIVWRDVSWHYSAKCNVIKTTNIHRVTWWRWRRFSLENLENIVYNF